MPQTCSFVKGGLRDVVWLYFAPPRTGRASIFGRAQGWLGLVRGVLENLLILAQDLGRIHTHAVGFLHGACRVLPLRNLCSNGRKGKKESILIAFSASLRYSGSARRRSSLQSKWVRIHPGSLPSRLLRWLLFFLILRSKDHIPRLHRTRLTPCIPWNSIERRRSNCANPVTNMLGTMFAFRVILRRLIPRSFSKNHSTEALGWPPRQLSSKYMPSGPRFV